MMNNILYIVVPCYNEEPVINETAKQLKNKLNALIEQEKISKKSKILFVDDGSKDKTWEIIEQLHAEDNLFTGVKLSCNKGHQNALLAGLTTAHKYADMTISMDADLQDDINAIDKMIDDYLAGSEIVYGVRSSRKKDTFFKKFTAQSFYKLIKKMGVDTVYNHADYRLMSSRAVEALLKFDETNLFLRGIIPQIGYKSSIVEYARQERFAGESKYPLKKMISFALDGITSFSSKPMTFIFTFGLIFSLLGFAAFVTTLVLHLTIAIASMYVVLTFGLFLCGIILLAMGIIGLYVGKIYIEVKHRPKFIIERELN